MKRVALGLGLLVGACFDKPAFRHIPDAEPDAPGSAVSPVAGADVDPSPPDHGLEALVFASCVGVVVVPFSRRRRSRSAPE